MKTNYQGEINQYHLHNLLNILVAEKETFFDILKLMPGGVSYATDASCREIIHNPVTANLLRIEEWDNLSHSSPDKINVKIFRNNRELSLEDLPIQRSAWYGEVITGMELDFAWDDGIRKTLIWNSVPLKQNGQIIGAIATCDDITHIKQLEKTFN